MFSVNTYHLWTADKDSNQSPRLSPAVVSTNLPQAGLREPTSLNGTRPSEKPLLPMTGRTLTIDICFTWKSGRWKFEKSGWTTPMGDWETH